MYPTSLTISDLESSTASLGATSPEYVASHLRAEGIGHTNSQNIFTASLIRVGQEERRSKVQQSPPDAGIVLTLSLLPDH